MSREALYRMTAELTIKEVVVPRITQLCWRIESLAEKMLENKEPEQNEQRLKDILDASVGIRCYADKL